MKGGLAALLRIRPHEVELLRPSRPVPPLAWLLLAAGGLASCGAALLALPAWQQYEVVARQQRDAQAVLAALTGESAGGAAQHPAGAVREQAADARAVVTELRRPWHELFDQIEAAQGDDAAGVHLQQMSIDARFAGVQLVAEGKDLDRLLRFSQRLGGGSRPGPIVSMTMTHYEWRDALGAHVVSASLQGQLAAASSGSAP